MVGAGRHRVGPVRPAHVMAGAVLELFPEAKFGFGPPVADGFYLRLRSSTRADGGGPSEDRGAHAQDRRQRPSVRARGPVRPRGTRGRVRGRRVVRRRAARSGVVAQPQGASRGRGDGRRQGASRSGRERPMARDASCCGRGSWKPTRRTRSTSGAPSGASRSCCSSRSSSITRATAGTRRARSPRSRDRDRTRPRSPSRR